MNKQILLIISTILAIIFISTGVVHTLQKTDEFQILISAGDTELHFETAFYYVIVTMTTIGYGDLYPATKLTRFVLGFFIITVIVIMTRQTSKLNELMKRSSRYRRRYKGEPDKHVVVTGSFNGVTLYRFLKEFYHPDHNMSSKKCKIVLIKDETPSKDMLAIINHPVYEEAVFYIEANFLNEHTLKDAMLKEARAVFILTNQYDDEPEKLDTYAVLASSAAKEFAPSTPVFLQLVKPDLLIHHYWAGWEIGFSTWKIKASLLAANAFTPGFSTMIANLVTSSSGAIKQFESNHWMNEYTMGLSNELYLVSFPDHLINMEFSEIVKSFYLKYNSLIIGVQTNIIVSYEKNNILEDELYEIYLNPNGYFIRPGDKAFIITTDQEYADYLSELVLTEVENEFSISSSQYLLDCLESRDIKRSNLYLLEIQHYIMYEKDLRGFLWDHILIFGKFEHFEIAIESLNAMTNQIICFVCESPPDDRWQKLCKDYSNALYLECSFADIEEISHTAINFAYHAIIFSGKIPGSSMEDSAVLNLVGIIESNFTCKYTLELIDESNLIYLNKKPDMTFTNVPYVYWPRYASSHVFFSSALEYVLAQGFHNNFLLDIVQRMIIYEDLFGEIGIDENYRINSLEIPPELGGNIVFGEVFCYLLTKSRPVIALGIYRGVGILNNEIPYVFTKPDPHTPILPGDTLIVMGETNHRDDSPYLKKLTRRDTMIFEGSHSASNRKFKRLNSIFPRKNTKADAALKHVEEDEHEVKNKSTDEEILQFLIEMMSKSKQQREMLTNQNKVILKLASEFNTMDRMLDGDSLDEMESEEYSESEEM